MRGFSELWCGENRIYGVKNDVVNTDEMKTSVFTSCRSQECVMNSVWLRLM